MIEDTALVEAATGLLERMSSTYRARNGKDVGIEGDDGEKCWIVHSDEVETLRYALAQRTNPTAPVQGDDAEWLRKAIASDSMVEKNFALQEATKLLASRSGDNNTALVEALTEARKALGLSIMSFPDVERRIDRVLASRTAPMQTADQLKTIIRRWLDSDDPSHWGTFEKTLDAAISEDDSEPRCTQCGAEVDERYACCQVQDEADLKLISKAVVRLTFNEPDFADELLRAKVRLQNRLAGNNNAALVEALESKKRQIDDIRDTDNFPAHLLGAVDDLLEIIDAVLAPLTNTEANGGERE